MAEFDRNGLADDIAALGLKALSGSVRPTSRAPLSLERVLESVERLRDKAAARGDSALADRANRVLDTWRGRTL